MLLPVVFEMCGPPTYGTVSDCQIGRQLHEHSEWLEVPVWVKEGCDCLYTFFPRHLTYTNLNLIFTDLNLTYRDPDLDLVNPSWKL